MIGMQYNLQGRRIFEGTGFGSESKVKKEGCFASNEPISVLDTGRSPSPSTSTSTLSSCFGGRGNAGSGGGGGGSGSSDEVAGLAAVWPVTMHPEAGSATGSDSAGADQKEEWVSELQPMPTGLEVPGGERLGFGLEDWDSLLSESGQDPSFLRWISGEVDDGVSPCSLKQLLQGANPSEINGNGAPSAVNPSSRFEPGCSGTSSNQSNNAEFGSIMPDCKPSEPGSNMNATSNVVNPQIPMFGSLNNLLFQQLETLDEKPQIFSQQLSQVTTHNANLFSPSIYAQKDPLSLFQPHAKRQNLGVSISDPHSRNLNAPLLGLSQKLSPSNYLQAIYDQLYKAVELILAGNFSLAQGILARLNHQLFPVSKKPFSRAAFYFKEALQLLLLMPNPAAPLPIRNPTPVDGFLKMGAYKLLSEVSPLVHFMNFTSNQAILEAIEGSARVHVIDFDIGCGAQWASFMQELRGTPYLKITAFASPSTHHPVELCLMHENLTQFANEIGVTFELEVVNFDAFDPSSYPVPPFLSSEKEVIVVNFPIWACSKQLSIFPSLLRFIKQLGPKIVVSMERGCERVDLPFSHHFLHALQYYEALLDSIDASNVNSETTGKIEKFLVQPMIENIVLGRIHAPQPMLHWKALFATAGFSQVNFSNFAETQGECVLKRSQVGGFHIEKRGTSLVLCWQHRELMLASAWKIGT
ncbi:hypothetical protein NMG60_11027301 [Bertholletia excelsa]